MRSKMRVTLLSLCVVIIPQILSAKCIEGNCYDGYGTFIYASGAKYTGQFQNGKINGEGILFFTNGNKYIGEWKEQYRQGRGKMIFVDGNVYEGQFRRSKMSGYGEMRFTLGDRYVGQWVDDIQHGKGTYYYNNGDTYIGDFVRGKLHGYGVMTYSDGASFSGYWKFNYKDGQGEMRYTDGQVRKGFWENGEYVGAGQSNNTIVTAHKQDENTNVSDLRNCNEVYCADGEGILTYTDGSRYIGQFSQGDPEGQGTCYYANGDKYVGGWLKHSPQGEGIMYYKDSRVMAAIWDKGRPIKMLESENERMPTPPSEQPYNDQVRVWAVVVGVANYTHMQALRYTDDDAYQIYAFLKSPQGGALPDQQIRVLIDEEATHANIRDAMSDVFYQADANDVVLFYFSGHGLDGSFIPIDFDGFNNRLTHEEIKEAFANSRAKHKICFADACHSGSLMAVRSTNRNILKEYYDAFNRSRGGTALLVSSKRDEYSLEDNGLRQGIFSHYLIRGLKGEANTNDDYLVTIDELYKYIYQKVRTYTANAQTPFISGSYDGNMPVAVIRE